MDGQLNAYKVRPIQTWGPGVTQKRALASIFAMKPTMLDDVMVRMFTANNCPTIENLLKAHTQVREFDTDDEYTWRMYGTTYKNIALIEARDEDGNVITSSMGDEKMVGKGAAPFELVFPEAYFADGEIIVGNLNEYYQFRILGDPIFQGTNAVYTVELMAGAETGIPATRLQVGELFSWEFAPVERDLSRKAGGIRKSTATTMRNEWTKIRKYNKFVGGAQNLRLETSIPLMGRDENGNIVKRNVDSWFYNEEWIFNNEWRREKSRAIMYSRSNRNSNGNYFNHGKSGNVIQEGDGIKAQMEYGNLYTYNDFNENFSIKGLANAIYDICEQGVDMKDRTFVITTGNRGMIQVNEAIKKETAGFDVVLDNSSVGVVSKVSNPVHQNSLAVGGQYVEFRGANNVTLKFVYDQSYDDRERNKIMGPNGKGVLNSYVYDIFDMGSSSDPNMYICKVKGEDDIFKYIIGMRNPWGITNNNVISHDEDSAEIHAMSTVGALVKDPTRTLRYVPAGLIA